MEVRINDYINGDGLYATKTYNIGDIVHILQGEIYHMPTKYTIHTGNNAHILDHYGRFINHSFNPSTYIDGIHVVASRQINVNDEITFDYNRSETTMAEPFMVDGKLVSGN